MKKILITDGAGSFPWELSVALKKNGHQVYGHVSPGTGSPDGYPGIDDSHEAPAVSGVIGDALQGMDVVIHLAGFVTPDHDPNEDGAYQDIVRGTRDVVDAIIREGRKSRLVLLSTTATYGDTTAVDPPVTTESAQDPNSGYARSFMEAEQEVLKAGIPYTILRVADVVTAAPTEPASWPFIADQRVELVYIGDVVSAVVAAVEKEAAANRILLIAGGLTWQMEGRKFMKEFLQALNVPLEDARYAERPLYTDWYDTTESQRILGYQDTSFPQFLELLTEAVDEARSIQDPAPDA